MKFVTIAAGIVALCAVGCATDSQATQAPAPLVVVELPRRTDNGPYRQSAFSFRYAAQNEEEHHNRVDVVYDLCEQIHLTPYGGEYSRVTDLGATEPSAIGAIAEGPRFDHSFKPQAGHWYLQEFGREDLEPRALFQVISVDANSVSLRWRPVGKGSSCWRREHGVAGTKGQCGGRHDES